MVRNLDNSGLPLKKTEEQLADISNALSQFEGMRAGGALKGLNGGQIQDLKENLVKSQVLQGLANRVANANSPGSDAKPGATQESEAIHQTSSADVKLNENYIKEFPIAKPDDLVNSAMKAIQIETNNLTKDLNKMISSFGSYIDAVSGPPKDLSSLLGGSADSISGFQKIINDQMMEFNQKKLNSELTKVVAALPLSERSKFGDIKSKLSAQILKGFNKVSDKQGGLLKGILSKALAKGLAKSLGRGGSGGGSGSGETGGGAAAFTIPPLEELVEEAKQKAAISQPAIQTTINSDGTVTISPGIATVTYPRVPMCAAEDIIGEVLSASREDINEMNNGILENLNGYLGDVKGQLDEIDQLIKPTARDGSKDGGVISITDAEVENFTRGGSGYVTKNNVGTAFTGSVMPGITTTGTGTGSGLTVNIVVSTGGGTSDFITLTAGGSGYAGIGTNVSTSSSGDGTGCTVNYTGSAGAVTGININSAGSGYKSGEVLTISGGGANATFILDKVAGAVDANGITVNKKGSGYRVGDILYVIGGNNQATFTVTQVVDPGNAIKNEVTSPSSGPLSPPGSPGGPPSLASGLAGLGNIQSSLASALNFKNMISNVFPFELPPIKAVSDFYTFATGSGSLPDKQLPSVKNLADKAIGSVPSDVVPTPKLPMVGPRKDELPVNLGADLDSEIASARAGDRSGLNEALDMF